MLICTNSKNCYEVFDTQNGINYRLSLFDDGSVAVVIESLSNEIMAFRYEGEQAVSFWEQLPYHSDGIKKMKFFNEPLKVIRERNNND